MRKIKPTDSNTTMDCPCEVSSSSKEKNRKIYPNFRMDHKYFPESKKWEVGKDYTVTLKLTMVGNSISRFNNESEFEIKGIDPEATAEESDGEDDSEE